MKKGGASPDVYNMQLSNEPAEELADLMVKTSGGAFELCGFVSGGRSTNWSPAIMRLYESGMMDRI